VKCESLAGKKSRDDVLNSLLIARPKHVYCILIMEKV
jgi:hypothetical protein